MRILIAWWLVFLSGAAAASPLTSVKIDSWGYRDFNHSKYSEQYCLGEFSPVVSEYRAIKSKRFSHELENAFYRFTLIREVYDLPAEAEARLLNIKEQKYQNSRVSKECHIRQAFLSDNTVYQVHSDVGAFSKELRRVMKNLQRQILL